MPKRSLRLPNSGRKPTPPLSQGNLVAAVLVLLVTYIFVTYRHGITLPFINDDYVFLDKVRDASFLELWRMNGLVFAWYRPWSQDFHYWLLFHLFGTREAPYHLVSVGLWLGVVAHYFLFVRRIAGPLTAAFSSAGLIVMGAWAVTILWVAGAQDLWMLLFGLLGLHSIAAHRWIPAAALFGLALLSKETAASLPGIAVAYLFICKRLPPVECFRKTALSWVVLFIWALAHPTLIRGKELAAFRHDPTLHASTENIVTKTLLAQVNLDAPFLPWLSVSRVIWEGALSGITVLLLIILVRKLSPPYKGATDTQGRVALFGLAWAGIAWSALFVPSIGWHPYYGLFGSLGFWLAAGAMLGRHHRVGMVLIFVLAILRQAQAVTLSEDWGTESHQVRAGALLRQIRTRLFELHPSLPPRSRLYFAQMPPRIGLLAGDGPSIRIWYGDSSLHAHYFSAYRPNYPRRDYFFIFDPHQVLREIYPQTKIGPSLRGDRLWLQDHDLLASLFLTSGDLRGAAVEYASLSETFPDDPDWAMYAGATFAALGDSGQAKHYHSRAVSLLGRNLVEKWWSTLIERARNTATRTR